MARAPRGPKELESMAPRSQSLVSSFKRVLGFGFRVFGFRVWGFRFRV